MKLLLYEIIESLVYEKSLSNKFLNYNFLIEKKIIVIVYNFFLFLSEK